MGDLFNTIALQEEDFGKENLWNKVSEALKLLTDAGYVCVVEVEVEGIVLIRYNYVWEEYGCAKPEWLLPEERELIQSIREQSK